MVSMLDGRRTEASFQPILGEAGSMGATVAEVTPRVDKYMAVKGLQEQAENVLDLKNYYDKSIEQAQDKIDAAAKQARTGGVSETTLYKEQLRADQNAVKNDYALKISSLKTAYDQGKISKEQLDIKSRAVTDEYTKQNLVSVSDLNSIRDNTIGVNISGLMLKNEFAMQQEREKLALKRQEEDTKYWTDNYSYLRSLDPDKRTAEIARLRRGAESVQNSAAYYQQAVATGDDGIISGAQKDVETATSNSFSNFIPMDMSNKLDRGEAITPDDIDSYRQQMIAGYSQALGDPARASILADMTLKRMGVEDMVAATTKGQEARTKYLGSQEEWAKKSNELMVQMTRRGIYTSYPQVLQIAALGDNFAQIASRVDPGLFTDLGQQYVNIISNPKEAVAVTSQMTPMAVAGMKATVNDPDAPVDTQAASIVAVSNAEGVKVTPEQLQYMDRDQLMTALKNATNISDIIERPGFKNVYNNLAPDMQDAINDAYAREKGTVLMSLFRSMKESAVSDLFRWDADNKRVVLLEDGYADRLKTADGFFETVKAAAGNVWRGGARFYAADVANTLNDQIHLTNNFVKHNSKYQQDFMDFLAANLQPLDKGTEEVANTFVQDVVTGGVSSVVKEPQKAIETAKESISNFVDKPKETIQQVAGDLTTVAADMAGATPEHQKQARDKVVNAVGNVLDSFVKASEGQYPSQQKFLNALNISTDDDTVQSLSDIKNKAFRDPKQGKTNFLEQAKKGLDDWFKSMSAPQEMSDEDVERETEMIQKDLDQYREKLKVMLKMRKKEKEMLNKLKK